MKKFYVEIFVREENSKTRMHDKSFEFDTVEGALEAFNELTSEMDAENIIGAKDTRHLTIV